MKTLTSSLLLAIFTLTTQVSLATGNESATLNSIIQECERQMLSGVCFAQTERNYPGDNETILLSGAGRVSRKIYYEIMKKYNIKNPSDISMCKFALRKITLYPGSDYEKISRAMWTPK